MYTQLTNEQKALHRKRIINGVSERIKGWYKNVLIDYEIVGSAVVTIDEEREKIVITYTEDGVTNVWEMFFCYDYSYTAEYFYDCWCSLED